MLQAKANKLGMQLTVILSSLIMLLSSCTYKDRVAPIRLPGATNSVTVADGLRISATAYTDPEQSQQAFGFNSIKAGVLPVQLTFQNDSPHTVTINPDQTFLIDYSNNAWPILTQEKTYQRTKSYVDVGETVKGAGKPALLMGAAGAVAGAAIGIITGSNVGEAMGKGAVAGAAAGAVVGGADSYSKAGEEIRGDLASKRLTNKAILPRQLAYGALFFPGKPGMEAESAAELRLSLNVDGVTQIVNINLH